MNAVDYLLKPVEQRAPRTGGRAGPPAPRRPGRPATSGIEQPGPADGATGQQQPRASSPSRSATGSCSSRPRM
ncbi:MAG: hypothetical protein MZV64_42505 [Ignavibacteriales bacterium]|nr:hypothetical protein [Ignavibacteriales bacterium]